ncbi:SchA/CurD-like domain-containing protein [Streptomyces sp. ISL-100]|uniref:SchA/CurD-like domain-containing protein n=1 Tax=Streptomyces sp. ISL-100 TaxID=2819173 RepID=UPI001BEADBAC|nr:SchA/CurD-like domain-containing protein [Streptomyces sp. ISL-100]MBT2400854.1 antibiotic biosynthesis monooxygenase [Streptomyces sp. ISL-100]
MTALSQRVSQSAFDGSRLRVVLLLDLHEGEQQQFLEAYDHLRDHVAAVPGHLSDQLCQSFENPSQWLVTSEWQDAPSFLAWVNSEEHVETVKPMSRCVREMRSLRYSVLRETGRSCTEMPERSKDGLQVSPRLGDGVVRHALTFTVRPGSEQTVANILAGYTSPAAQVDEHTRLCRTSLFMHGNRVVRTIEVQGDLLAALRHVARQPEIRAVEEAINPYLEQDRDLDDPQSARLFFTRAALPAVHHMTTDGLELAGTTRHALYYQAKEGCGMALARLLAHQDEAAANHPHNSITSSTVFQRDDIVVRLLDVRGRLDAHPCLSFGVDTERQKTSLARLLDHGANDGTSGSTHEVALHPAVPSSPWPCEMQLITDRCASPES